LSRVDLPLFVTTNVTLLIVLRLLPRYVVALLFVRIRWSLICYLPSFGQLNHVVVVSVVVEFLFRFNVALIVALLRCRYSVERCFL